MRLTPALLLSLCCLACADVVAQEVASPPAEEAAETIKLPLPWKLGQLLRYETEQVETKTSPQGREKSRTTSMTDAKTVEAGKDGFVQHWRTHDMAIEVMEGDATFAKVIEDAARQLEDLPMIVEADAAGALVKVRNIEAISARMRQTLRPVFTKVFLDGMEKGLANADPEARKKAMDAAPAQADALIDRLTEPKLLEAQGTAHIGTLLNFSGAELENDQAYELESELENPTGGKPFPAKLTFGLYVTEDRPEDVFLEWTLEIDPLKGADAVWDTVEKLYGRTISAQERKELPQQVSIVDKGFLVFERATGLPEMYQNERTTKVAENASYERNRMRLLGNPHEHEWSEQLPQETEPELSGGERDAQLCATDEADITAAIAACSRLLENDALEAKARARWVGARGWHRLRAKQGAEAVADYTQAITLAPELRFFLARSRAHALAGDKQAALVDARHAVELEPKAAQAHVMQGAAHDRLEQWPEAVSAYGKAIELSPREAMLYDARCWAKAMTGDLDGGKADCDRALELDAASWNSLNSRGFIHHRKGDHAASVSDYSAALEHEPEVASSWYVRGMSRRALGDEAAAKADIAKALELDSGIAERYARYGVK